MQRSLNYKYSFEFVQNLLEKYFEIYKICFQEIKKIDLFMKQIQKYVT
ncbi:hypothetical protein CCAN2_2050040 [Capnocytophaga canimorsus]|nr:hypothetical protein CCAN2_2050040 [Capnocytophaga canimorsus]